MPLPRQEVDGTTPKYLRDKYAIVGVGETTYTRGSGITTRALGTWAVRNAILDAGLKPSDIDGMLDYSGGDSTSATFISGDLGLRLNYYMDVVGGGSSTEALVGIAIGLIEAGCCKTVAIFRSMNGFSQVRIGGTGARSAAPVGGDVGRCNKPRLDMHYQHGPISTVAGHYAKNILWPNSGVGPEDIDATGSYDAFTFTTMLQLEDYGFCKKGEGGNYVSDGTIGLGGRRPNHTSGGHLCEGYTHGMNMVIENTRQLRHDADDSCPIGADGKRQHTYDYSEGGCRQVKDAELSANLGWAMPGTGSAMVMQRG